MNNGMIITGAMIVERARNSLYVKRIDMEKLMTRRIYVYLIINMMM